MDDYMPNEIIVDQDAQDILIDGKPFPFYVSPDGVQCGYDSQGVPCIHVKIMADRVIERERPNSTTYELVGATDVTGEQPQ